MRSEKGVTLIVLVVSLLIILILVRILISDGFGRRGIVKEGIQATETSYHDNVRDALLILQTSYTSKSEFWDYLKDNIYIDKEGKVNVKNLLESTDCEYGTGTGVTDVYVLDKDLNLTYYDKNGDATNIADLGYTMEP